MKRLILPICVAAVIVAAAVLLIVCRTPKATDTGGQVARDIGRGPADMGGRARPGGGDGAGQDEDFGWAEPTQTRTRAEAGPGSEGKAPAQGSTQGQKKAPSSQGGPQPPDGTRSGQPGMGGPPPGEGGDTADRPAMRPGRFLERMDTNGDGKVSKAEWRKHYEENFAQADKNSDGYIDKTEIPQFGPPGGMGGGRRSGEGPGPGGPPGDDN